MRYVSLTLVLLLLFFSTGCWNAREINELAFVLSMALDKADNGFKVTAQIAKPDTYSKSPTGGGGKEKERPFWVISSTGTTIFEAIRNMAAISPRRIFWSHIKVIIIGEELARSNLREMFDFFSRNPEMRFRTLIAVTPGEAGKLLEINPLMERDPALHLEQIIQKKNLTGTAYSIMLKDFLEEYLDPNISPVASRIIVSETNNQQVLKIYGAAVFDNQKLVGWLEGKETMGLLWIKNKIKNTVMVVSCPYDGLPISIEIKQGKTSFQSDVINGIPSFTIKVEATGNVTEKACLTEINVPEVRRTLESALASAIQKDIQSTINAAQGLGVDYLGLSDILHRQHKKEWQQMSANWPQTFEEAGINILVDAKIPSVSLLAKSLVPIKTPGEEKKQ